MGDPSLALVTEPVMLPGRIIWLKDKLARAVAPERTLTVKDEF
jgi:hypothetical protein